MWKLIISDDETTQTSLALALEQYSLGRAEDNTIRLTDRNVSRKQAILLRRGQKWFLKDLGSSNGTVVNGFRIGGEQAINPGDLIQVGDYRLDLQNELLKTQPPALAMLPTPAVDIAPVPATYRPPNRLVVVVGPNLGAEFPLTGQHFTIGRAETASISINHSSVSRIHAELHSLGDDRYEVIDKDSANGIRINGMDLKRGILEAGDALELGDVRLRFVGAGKVYRLVTEHGKTIKIIGPFGTVPPESVDSLGPPTLRKPSVTPAQRRKVVTLVVALLAIAALVVAFAAGRRTADPSRPKDSSAAPSH